MGRLASVSPCSALCRYVGRAGQRLGLRESVTWKSMQAGCRSLTMAPCHRITAHSCSRWASSMHTGSWAMQGWPGPGSWDCISISKLLYLEDRAAEGHGQVLLNVCGQRSASRHDEAHIAPECLLELAEEDAVQPGRGLQTARRRLTCGTIPLQCSRSAVS